MFRPQIYGNKASHFNHAVFYLKLIPKVPRGAQAKPLTKPEVRGGIKAATSAARVNSQAAQGQQRQIPGGSPNGLGKHKGDPLRVMNRRERAQQDNYTVTKNKEAVEDQPSLNNLRRPRRHPATTTGTRMASQASPRPKSKTNSLKVTSDAAHNVRSVRANPKSAARKVHEQASCIGEAHNAAQRVNTSRTRMDGNGANYTSRLQTRDVSRPTSPGASPPYPHGDQDYDERAQSDVNMTQEVRRDIETSTSDGEEQLDHEHSDTDGAGFETRFRQTTIMIAFSTDEPTIPVPNQGYWGLTESSTGIVQVCESNGVALDAQQLAPVDGQLKEMVGRPKSNDRKLWMLLRRGLEYSNANYMSAKDIDKVLQCWGAMEAVVVSHGASRVRHGKWPSIACVNNAVRDPDTGEIKFAFWLCFECADTANRVYQAFWVRADASPQSVEDGRTIRLAPIRNIEWNAHRQVMIRPWAAIELEDLSRRLHVFGIRPELTPKQIEEKLIGLGYEGTTVSLQASRWWGTLTLHDDQTADRLYESYGVQQHKRLFIGNIKLFVNKPEKTEVCGAFGAVYWVTSPDSAANALRNTRAARNMLYQGDNRQVRGRANDRWQNISRNITRQLGERPPRVEHRDVVPTGAVTHATTSASQRMRCNSPTGENVVEEHADTPLSSDDSSNSENEDTRLLLDPTMALSRRHKRGRRRRRWCPHLDRMPHEYNRGGNTVHEGVQQREHYVEQYLGVRGDIQEDRRDYDIRIATTNINKGFWGEMYTKTCPWFIANNLDFLVVADAALGNQEGSKVYSRSHHGGQGPALLKQETVYSPSGRSIRIIIRVGTRSHLQVTGTYCPDTAHRTEEATYRERRWIEGQLDNAKICGYMNVVAGDFNAYPDERIDRQSDWGRGTAAQQSSDDFRDRTGEQSIVSCVQHRFPLMPRFTYQNGSTRTSLADIYISARHSHQIRRSGIWMYSINRSDHIGTPFVSIELDRAQRTRTHLQHAQVIKVLPVKGATTDELYQFASHVEKQIATRAVTLVDPLHEDQVSNTEIDLWLDKAIDNPYISACTKLPRM
ncbi:unnamed protein product [Phytophthora fragariaefolia]|uniref:Unnamed protein product n=1 Tax=Phytophthora fragariaefolia TaxID=1490495 RepID=A0A9W6XE86_9STRA|nr:unnamed protein product [Phytophthora fragariaefolia]